MRVNSLTLRLLGLTLLVVLFCGGLALTASYRTAIHEADELMDAQMAQTAQTLLSLSARQTTEAAEGRAGLADTGPPHHRYQSKLMFQLWQVERGHEVLILRSPNAPTEKMLVERSDGFYTDTWQGRTWRFYAQSDVTDAMLAVVGQDFAIREELASETAQRGLIPFMAGIPVLALMLYLAIRAACTPVRRLADDLAARAPESLHPVSVGPVARELLPVTTALDRLFARVQATLHNERRFTSDAAHELRTPIAALIAQLQAAQMAADSGQMRDALKKCEQGAQRVAHLVQQMLTLARLDESGAAEDLETLDLAELARAVCADLGPAAVAGRLTLELDAEAPCALRGRPEMLRILLRNLVDNAIRYTPPEGRVSVALRSEGDAVVCIVEDNGPGVAAEALPLLGQRFRRLAGTVADGVGLGLSIVHRIVALHGGSIAFDKAGPPSGLRVTVRLPLQPGPVASSSAA